MCEVITIPLKDTAANDASCGDQQTLNHSAPSLDDNQAVHVFPSLEVTTLFDPLKATPTNNPSSPDQQTPVQPLVGAVVIAVQVVPFDEVIILFVPPSATAANNP